MAIKKGAFEQYANHGRQLPKKQSSILKNKNHIFDAEYSQDIIDNGSQMVHDITQEMVHKRFTKDINSIDLMEEVITDNGSQMVHDITQETVHKRFTNDINSIAIMEEFTTDNGSQTVHNITREMVHDITQEMVHIKLNNLSHVSKKIIMFFYKNMKKNNGVTEELTLDAISALAGVNKKSLKNTLFRLSSSGAIIRVEQKTGRGGWVKYQLPSYILDEINFNA